MFRENDSHYQMELFSHYHEMDERIVKLLEKSWAPVFYREVFCKINEEVFAPLYCEDNGRPNFPVNILVALEIIKHLHDYTDKELLEQFYFNYQVMYALGIRNLGQVYFAERTLYEFRERVFNYLEAHPEKEDILFTQFETLLKNFIAVLGLKTKELRIDSTPVSSYIKKGGRLSLAYDVLVQAIKAVPQEKRSQKLEEALDKKFKAELLYYSRNKSLDRRFKEVIELMTEVLETAKAHPELLSSQPIKIMQRFLKEQTVYSEKEKKLIPRETSRVSPASLQSAYDTEATFREKGNQKHTGYVLNITETCFSGNETQLITDFVLAPNNKSDSAVLKERLERVKKEQEAEHIYADGGYYSPSVVEKAESLGIKIHYTNMTGRKSKTEQLPLSAFEFDRELKVIKCPAGKEPIKSRCRAKSKSSTAHFRKEDCLTCPLRAECPVKEQKESMVLRVSRRQAQTEACRQEIKDRSIKYQNTSKRAGIEGTASALKRSQGLARLRVRGFIKCAMQCTYKVIGHNFKQFYRVLKKRRLAFSLSPPGRGLVCPNPA